MKFDVTQMRTVNFRTTVEILDDEVPADREALRGMLDEGAFEQILESFGDGDEEVTIDYLTLDWTEWEIEGGKVGWTSTSDRSLAVSWTRRGVESGGV